MTFEPWLVYLVLAFVALVIIFLAVSWSKEKKRANELERSALERDPYFLDTDDRSAMGQFIGDHLDDNNHPNRGDMVRILARWGSSR